MGAGASQDGRIENLRLVLGNIRSYLKRRKKKSRSRNSDRPFWKFLLSFFKQLCIIYRLLQKRNICKPEVISQVILKFITFHSFIVYVVQVSHIHEPLYVEDNVWVLGFLLSYGSYRLNSALVLFFWTGSQYIGTARLKLPNPASGSPSTGIRGMCYNS